MTPQEELREHIAARVVQPQPDCLIWLDAVDRGYGRIWANGRTARVHRVAWELANGPIPDGLTIDHLCRIRSCCNTAHMELVPPAENTRRAAGVKRWRRRPMPLYVGGECSSGHALDSEAALIRREGRSPSCRFCKREADRRRRSRARARAA